MFIMGAKQFYQSIKISLILIDSKFMQLGQQLASLKLQHSFIKELNSEDLNFAQKQYQKLYAEEMSKFSFKLQKIQRVKRNLYQIEQGEDSKLKNMKDNLNKKYDFIQKNKQKYMTQKIKSYKIHHEFWDHKITSIKRKNREYMRAHADKSQKYSQQIQQFWKTKTQQAFSTTYNHLQTQKKKSISLSRRSDKNQSKKMHTEGRQRKKSILLKKQQHFSRQNTQINDLSQHNNHSRRQTKSIRFTTEGHKENNVSNLSLSKRKNESNLSEKLTLHSLKNNQPNNFNQTKKSIKMPYLDQNRFSHQLTSENKMNSTHNNLRQRKSINQEGPQGFRLTIRNQLLAQQSNFSFQKAMKKLDKIQKIKQKNMKKLQPSQTALSPSKPRKPINAEQYRLLRTKTQVKKSKTIIETQQNIQNKEPPSKDRFTGSRIIHNRTLDSQQRYHKTKNIDESRLSIEQSRIKREEERSHERSLAIESQTKRWKKQRIMKAIKDRIFQIKLEEMQKIKQKQVL